MVTLIAVHNSDGCVGRCDAKCYLASNPACACVCGGMNHGVGLADALENTVTHAAAWPQAHAQERRTDNPRAALGDQVAQGSLFS